MSKEYLNMNECPYCKSSEGYFSEVHIEGNIKNAIALMEK
ncbi:hypothetical protein CJD_0580 [Clostridium perfringens D str. JGS1721]|uniref:Uncharacterized protein n=1 Tax=Clostridium perfringens D str. JGS1721 TaxID=488537 RepID=B1V0K6_CLOPF|nr:hypothetical protein CJD_0580 [Clostridium perfringens D str. JGS1721]